jgi:hypothetical protein
VRHRVAVLILVCCAVPAVPAGAASMVARDGMREASRYAAARAGSVAFAVADERGRVRGHRVSVPFASASLSKAMLLVAALRRARDRPLSGPERAALRPMITLSDNDAAWDVYRMIGGGPAVQEVARAARMRHFVEVGWWSDEQLTAADQARLFYRIDRLVPRRHRGYARRLLSSVVAGQRWGIAPAAAARGVRAFFKGGWREEVVHQAALLERGGRRIAIAVLTRDSPSQAYARQTIAGVAARLLGPSQRRYGASAFERTGAGLARP